jgi:hypothetical protein
VSDPRAPRFLDTPQGAVNNGAAMTERAPLEALRARLADTTLDYEWVVTHAWLVLDTRIATRDVRQGRTKVVRL